MYGLLVSLSHSSQLPGGLYLEFMDRVALVALVEIIAARAWVSFNTADPSRSRNQC